MLRYLDIFERIITRLLLVMMAGVVVLATIELAFVLGKDMLTPPLFVLEIDELLEVFGQFLLVLIGIELLHSMRAFSERRELHLESVLVVALIAVARKIIVMDPTHLPEGTLLGIAAIVLGLTAGYHLLGRSHRDKSRSDRGTRHEHRNRPQRCDPSRQIGALTWLAGRGMNLSGKPSACGSVIAHRVS